MKNKTLKVIGTKGISNTMSYNIYDFEHGAEDKVLSGLNGKKPRWRKLYNSPKLGLYFMASGTRYYLNDFLRI